MNHLPPITPEGTWTQPAKHGRVLEYLTPDGRRVQVRLWTFAEGVINGQPADLPCPMTDEEVPGLIMGALERVPGVKVKWKETEGKAEREKQKVEMGNGDQALAGAATAPEGGTLGTTCPTREGDLWSERKTVFMTAEGLKEQVTSLRRVLFLDVDGVLNTRLGSLDEDKLELLRHLIVMSGASVVVSSSWRTVPEQLERLTDALVGMEIMPIGCTPDLTITKGNLHLSKDRWQEIEAWLLEHPYVDQFVILDDLPSMGPLQPHHVRTMPEFGLSNLQVMEALMLFDEQAQAKGDRGPWMPAQAGKEAV